MLLDCKAPRALFVGLGDEGSATEMKRFTQRNATMNQPKIKRNPEATRLRILLAAADEFSKWGLAGARVDKIAHQAQTNERMLYYYFGSKEQLFTAVLEHAFSALAEAKRTLNVNDVPPLEAITCLAHFLWNYYAENPALLHLTNNENLHMACHLKKSPQVGEMALPFVEMLGSVLARGERDGVFRAGVEPAHLYVMLTSFGHYIVGNHCTLEATLNRDFSEPAERSKIIEMHIELLCAYLTKR